MENLRIADKEFSSRLFTGTGKFSSSPLMGEAIKASGSELVTVALKRVDLDKQNDSLLRTLNASHINLLPNTSGVRNAKEAVFAAQLAREALNTNWIKLEIHPDPKYLMPDPIETLKATEELVLEFFVRSYLLVAKLMITFRLREIRRKDANPKLFACQSRTKRNNNDENPQVATPENRENGS